MTQLQWEIIASMPRGKAMTAKEIGECLNMSARRVSASLSQFMKDVDWHRLPSGKYEARSGPLVRTYERNHVLWRREGDLPE